MLVLIRSANFKEWLGLFGIVLISSFSFAYSSNTLLYTSLLYSFNEDIAIMMSTINLLTTTIFLFAIWPIYALLVKLSGDVMGIKIDFKSFMANWSVSFLFLAMGGILSIVVITVKADELLNLVSSGSQARDVLENSDLRYLGMINTVLQLLMFIYAVKVLIDLSGEGFLKSFLCCVFPVVLILLVSYII